jgi:imidazolonepropionase-like amidohydrolase
LLALTVAAPAAAQRTRTSLARGRLAITDVTVIPLTRDTALPGTTVLIENGIIRAVGPSATMRLRADVRRIDGRGKVLIPGLADMHSHLFSDGEVPDSVGPYELGVMVANGITATRMMMGTPAQLALRDRIAAGRLVGPELWLASPEFAGRAYGGAEFKGKVVATPEQARAAVDEVAAQGFDFIKITLFVNRPVYDALVERARSRGIRVVGHVDPDVGVPHALESGQHIEHLDNYVEQILADSSPVKQSVSDRGVYRPEAWKSLDYVDPAKIGWIAGLTARSGTFTTPTLTIFKNAFALGVPDEAVKSWPDWNIYPPGLRAMWLEARDHYWAKPAAETRRRRWVAVRNQLVRAIADSGGRIMAGSDAPEWFHAYGYTLHRELESLVTAGLSPYEALVAATRTPAVFLGADKVWGTIEPGKRADLVLLRANPLEDIRHTTAIDGVVVAGRWLDRAALDRMVEAAVVRLQATPAG